MCATVLTLEKSRECDLRTFRQAPAVRQPRALLDQARYFALFELQGVQLLRLVPQQLEFRVAITRLGLQVQRSVENLEPDTVSDAHLRRERIVFAIAVEQLPLRGAAHEGLEFVLPVNVDENVASLTQQLQRHRLSVQIRARTTI